MVIEGFYQSQQDACDYLDDDSCHLSDISRQNIRYLRENQLSYLRLHSGLQKHIEAVGRVFEFSKTQPCSLSIGVQGEIEISSRQEDSAAKLCLAEVLSLFCPWRLGPWRICGHYIDSQWRGEMKWNRIIERYPHLLEGDLKGKCVADVGAHNGYYMYRLSFSRAKWVVGFEPVAKHYCAYHIIQNLVRVPNLYLEPFGYQGLKFYPRYFDVIFCMGVLYHHTDPVGILRMIHASLCTGGYLILDTQGISGDRSVAFMPRKFYKGRKGYWWLPTLSCLLNMIQRAGFQKNEVFYQGILTEKEQRSSKLCENSLSCDDKMKTSLIDIDKNQSFLSRDIEKDDPWRFYVKAWK